MKVFKTGFPQDLTALFTVIKDQTVSTAKYLVDLVKQCSHAIYSSLEKMVERLSSSRVTVLTPQKFVIIPKTTNPVVAEVATITGEVSPQKDAAKVVSLPESVLPQKDTAEAISLTAVLPPQKNKEENGETVVTEKPKYPMLGDVSNRVNAMSKGRIPDLEISVLKMIDLARGVFKAPIENNQQLTQKILDPFQTSAYPED
ncbi:MAG TPA: hypothetical protein VLE96_02105 [Chlamydiales bacterium]|nr:hypothetical protein [Chlamydiales bacterium]